LDKEEVIKFRKSSASWSIRGCFLVSFEVFYNIAR